MASQHLQAEADSSSSDDEQRPAPREYLPAPHGIARAHVITGELLKQSVNNPDLWRRRQCFVVADKMWCLKPPKSSVAPWTRRRSTLISLAHSHASEGSGPSAANPKRRHAIELQTTDRVWRFCSTHSGVRVRRAAEANLRRLAKWSDQGIGALLSPFVGKSLHALLGRPERPLSAR